MKLSGQQIQALEKIIDWFLGYSHKKQIFRLFGYAGTGKTTLAKYVLDLLGQNFTDILFATLTGKASLVLRSKGILNAQTIHSLIYHYDKEEIFIDGKTNKPITQLQFKLNKYSELSKAKLLVLDECSMVDEKIAKDLLNFDKPILVLGDPAQLSPVFGTGFFINSVSDFLLTEIHRQAENNPIIKLAFEVRQGKFLNYQNLDKVKIQPKSQLTDDFLLEADQVIVGRNLTKLALNQKIRELKNFQLNFPEIGDKLICLKNNYKKGLFNGSIWFVDEFIGEGKFSDFFPKTFCKNILGKQKELHSGLIYGIYCEDEKENEIPRFTYIKLRRDYFENPEPSPKYDWNSEFDDFDFGYVITCHKSQGSSWNKILVFDESFCFKEDKIKWLYTAITRANEDLIILK